MSTETIKNLLEKKWQKLYPEQGQGLQSYSIEGREKVSNILKNLMAALEWISNPPAHIELIKTFKMGKVADDRVLEDPVGCELYKIGWERKRPDYAGEDWFMEEAHIAWSRLGGKELRQFESSWRMVGDHDTQIFFDQASGDQLFQFWFENEFLYQEKWLAFDALLCVTGRSMGEGEYLYWVNRFKLLPPQRLNP